MKQYEPNERIVNRAVEIWVGLLTSPKYDNLGKDSQESPKSIMANTAASALASMIPKNNTPEVLNHFADELKKILMSPLEWESDLGKPQKFTTVFNNLSVDYGPNVPLREAAKRAGLKMEFPWKTNMWLENDHLSVSNGYAAQSYYHYPLSGDRWLVTTLHGSDIHKITALIESGEISTELAKT